MIYTTLNKIREAHPCEEGWAKLLKHLGKTKPDDEPVSMLTILDSNGLDDVLWCTRTLPEYNNIWRLYAVWCARQIEHLMTDDRSHSALDVAERFANGQATEDELSAAWDAAWDAWDAAWDAARAARAAAWDTAWAARAARAAAWDTAWAARAARAAAGAAAGAAAARAAGDAAGDAARADQEQKFREIISKPVSVMHGHMNNGD